MDPVIHFEMPYDQPDRMKKFYQSAFGWELNTLGAEMGNYVIAMTAESDEAGPLKPGAINGGFFERMKEMPEAGTSVVIAVEDLQAGIRKVNGAGGKVLGEPMEIPGIGHFVSFQDTEGNRVSMLQPLPRRAKPAPSA